MNASRLWLLGGAVFALAIIALGWFAGASPLLTLAADTEAQVAAVKSQNAAEELVIAQMREQYESIDELRAELDELQVSVPGFANTADFFDELAARAVQSKVALQSVAVGGAQPYGAMGSTQASTDTATDAESASEDVAPAADATPAPSSQQGELAPPALPSASLASDLYVLTVTLQLDADQAQLERFLRLLQGEGRLVLVTDVTAGFGTSQRSSVTGYIFVVHDPRRGPVGSLPLPAPAETPVPEPSATPAPGIDETGAPTPAPTP